MEIHQSRLPSTNTLKSPGKFNRRRNPTAAGVWPKPHPDLVVPGLAESSYRCWSPRWSAGPGCFPGSSPTGYWWLWSQTPASPPQQPRAGETPAGTGLPLWDQGGSKEANVWDENAVLWSMRLVFFIWWFLMNWLMRLVVRKAIRCKCRCIAINDVDFLLDSIQIHWWYEIDIRCGSIITFLTFLLNKQQK